MPTTVLHVGRQAKRQGRQRADAASPEAAIKAGAKTTAAAEVEAEEQKPAKVAITTRSRDQATSAAVADEARKGYDLLVIGLTKTAMPKGGINRAVARAVAGFEGPLAVVAARGEHLKQPAESTMKILVPITGTQVSRRATEVAVALARANDAPITALYIASGDGRPPSSRQRHARERGGDPQGCRRARRPIPDRNAHRDARRRGAPGRDPARG